MYRDLETETRKIMKVFNALFKSIETREVTEDIDVGTDFDYIPAKVHGAAAFSPKEYLEAENLNWVKDEHGVSYLDTFIKLCVQVGGAMQYHKLTKKIEKERKNTAFYENLYDLQAKELRKLTIRAMPREEIHEELEKLREETYRLREENSQLKRAADHVKKAWEIMSK